MTAEGYDTVAPLQRLKELITIECLGENLYRGCNLFQPKYLRALYGGQVASQALMAATKSISDLDSSLLIHSIHCYFIGPSQASSELVYKVERIKAGKSFCTVSVQAVQQGRVTFHCLASFYKNDQENLGKELDYNRHPMPVVPHPDNGESERKGEIRLVNPAKRKLASPMIMHPKFCIEECYCIHPEILFRYLDEKPIKPRQVAWVRFVDTTFKEEHNQSYHRVVLTYLSDMFIAGIIVYKYPELYSGMFASLDHSVWFHSPVKADQWFLLVSENERFNGDRSLSTSSVYSEDGTKVATVAQETLVRPKL